MRQRLRSFLPLVAVVLLASGIASCGDEDPGPSEAPARDTPEQAFEAMCAAMEDKAFDRFWDRLATPSQRHFDEQLAEMKAALGRHGPEALQDYPRVRHTGMTADDVRGFVDGRALMIATLERMAASMTDEAWASSVDELNAIRVARVETQGTTARLHVVLPGGVEREIAAEVRGGAWRIDFEALED